MKKILPMTGPRAALIAALFATAVLSACGGGSSDPAPTPISPPVVTPPVVTPTDPAPPASAPQLRCAP